MKSPNIMLVAIILSFIALSLITSCNEKDNRQKVVNKVDTVIISGMEFRPSLLNIDLGDTVIWINKGIVAHNITDEAATTPLSKDFNPNESFQMVPTKSFNYYCSIHPTMKGAINIQANK
ncbi:MAG TPA: plastocyanin/azurin family copper-binding protein [Candidatus Kapabacteria bacterium]|nr:plastocyanin/azurin family copper-binding protein [Candidatus Kapabacteria bacterium]